MRNLGLVAAFGMPLSIFLLLGWKLIDRRRLEQRGMVARAVVTSVRHWRDEGITHQIVNYQFAVGGDYYSASTTVPLRGKGYATGDRFSALYLPWRPGKSQPVSGGPATGFTAVVMVAMVVFMLWMLYMFGAYS